MNGDEKRMIWMRGEVLIILAATIRNVYYRVSEYKVFSLLWNLER